ncbi:MAG: hypothetical protein R3253_09910, partial [Longimicrobiales bacterium]|nr:hypothetical protein [Longimicrobiales bacterium]
MSEKKNENRLPPPAFPPGSRRHPLRNSGPKVKGKVETVDDAFIGPDEPLPDRIDPFNDAFISPDEPLPERKLELAEAFLDAHAAASVEEGEVVGMDLDPHLQPSEAVSKGDPHVEELMTAVAKLAEAVRRRGEAGLRASPDMSRFEATLRAYCVGYLAGRRAEEPPEPDVE